MQFLQNMRSPSSSSQAPAADGEDPAAAVDAPNQAKIKQNLGVRKDN